MTSSGRPAGAGRTTAPAGARPVTAAKPSSRVKGREASQPAGRAGRWLFLSPPPGALAGAGWALLPLRAFLGFTFCFAGLQKLANPNFFNSRSPISIQAQLIAAERISPLHSLLGHLLQFATPIGILISLGELAVGLGALLGLWTRVAAVGGLILSLMLFLTVSFHSTPYYTGADIVFFFAWMPLILAGSGGVLSLDAVIASRARRESGLGSPTPVPVRFSLVQEVCGAYEDDRCAVQGGAPCDTKGCPFLLDPHTSVLERRSVDALDRRTLVLGGAAVGATAVAGGVLAGLVAGLGRAAGGAKAPPGGSTSLSPGSAAPTTTTTTAPSSSTTTPGSTSTSVPVPSGTKLGPAKDVPVGGAATFTDPFNGQPGIIIQATAGSFKAFNAVCPHAGCTVGYSQGAKLIVCPCHGSEFNPTTGAVEVGPAAQGLASIKVVEGPDGQIYAQR